MSMYAAKRKAVAARSGGASKVVPIYVATKSKANMPGGKVTAASSNSRIMDGTVEIRDPLFNAENLYMPKNIEMWNRWIRHYYKRHPLVGNCIDIHSTLPFSNPRYGGIEDKFISNFYEWGKEDVLHLYDWILASALEYTMLGEQFSFGTFNASLGTFDSITILNPDNLDVFPINFAGNTASRKYIISMKIPIELREIYQKSGNDPRFRAVFESLLPEIKNCVIQGKDIPLDPNNIFAMQRLASQYEKRGTSIVVRVMDWLMYEDKLRTAQMATADGNITPKQLWKLGNVANGYMPTAEDIQAFNELLAQGEHQEYYQIVTHEAVQYQSVIPSQGMMDVASQFDLCQKRILMGLYASDAWMGNDGPSFCFDEQTQILTEKGWREYHEVLDDEKLATFNNEDCAIEYQNFSERIVNKHYSGDMYEFDFFGGKGVRVSANHRMMVWDGPDKPHAVKLADEITGKDSFIHMSEIGFRMPVKIDGIKREEVSEETIWCFTVPNQFLIVRRNGLISIQGNSNAVVSLKVLKGRYKVALAMYEQIINDMNRKIAVANGFRRRTKAELDHGVRTGIGALIIPEINWPNNLGFNENYDRTQILIQLAEKHKISYKSLLEELGVDDHEEEARLEAEMDSPLADGYYEKRVQDLLDTADAIKGKGNSFGIGKDKVAPALPSSGGGGGEGSAAPALENKPKIREENPENAKIPTGGQEMMDSI